MTVSDKQTVLDPLLEWGAAGYRGVLWGIEKIHRLKILKIHRLAAPVVSVGNLTWGGTGKTPMVLQLANHFSRRGRRVAVLTRGYGGDEAALLTQRLSPIPVLVGPHRAALGRKAVEEYGANLLLLDDGYQQWRIKKDVEILMMDANAPFGNGHLIPRGILREPKEAAARADLIVMKDSNSESLDQAGIERKIRLVNLKAPIFWARYDPVGLTQWPWAKEVALRSLRGKRICALAGIANPKHFEETLASLGPQIILKYRVRDHHPYTVGEMVKLFTRCQRHGVTTVVTTAKDAVRIPPRLKELLGPELKGMEILILEVVLRFKPDESELLHRIDSLLAGPRN